MTRAHLRLGASGQASILLIGGLAGVLIATVIAGAVARAVGREAAAQRAADLAAVAAARVMHSNYGRLFEPAVIDDEPNPRHLDKQEYLALGRATALQVARANGARSAQVAFPDEATIAPVHVRVTVRETLRADRERATITARAEAELGPAATIGFATGGGYDGPLEYRQGKPMRPDVAQAFDRMEAAARGDGVALSITSAYRSDAEQAVLWNRNPNPRMVARPGTSLHRNGTELDLGPPSAYAWLAANAGRFHFLKRYSWEPWHFGYTLNPSSSPTSHRRRRRSGGRVPRRGAGLRAPRATRRCCAAPHSAGTSPRRCSRRRSTPSRASTRSRARRPARRASRSSCRRPRARTGLANPFDPEQAIDAQAHFMRDLLRQFGSVPLALAAYNAGPGRVSALRLRAELPGDPRLRRAHPRPDVGRRPADRARRRQRARGPAGQARCIIASPYLML